MQQTDLAIIGAGPYGLSVAAHAAVAGIPYRLFGDPMAFWKTTMLEDMLLRSPLELTSLSHPEECWTISEYFDTVGVAPDQREPVSRQHFLAYTAWFRDRVGITHEDTWVSGLAHDGEQFLLTAGPTQIRARNVVVATGLNSYRSIPALITANIPLSQYSHTADLPQIATWARQRVLVVGGGQSAFEAAIHAAQSRATVTLAQRAASIYYADIHELLSRMFVSVLSNSPAVFRFLPDRLHDPLRERMLPTTVAPWIEPQLAEHGVTVWCDATLAEVAMQDTTIHVTFQDGRRLEVDHIIAGTGYQVDLALHPLFRDAPLRDAIVTHDGMPHLDRHYQSSVPGLFFAGAMAMHSFGPAFNFIFGVYSQCRAMVDGYLADQVTRAQDS